MTKIITPSPAHIEAVNVYAEKNGRSWNKKLFADFAAGKDCGYLLQQVRNNYFNWLKSARFNWDSMKIEFNLNAKFETEADALEYLKFYNRLDRNDVVRSRGHWCLCFKLEGHLTVA